MTDLDSITKNREKTFTFLSKAIVNFSEFIADPGPSANDSLVDNVLLLRNMLTLVQPILGSEISDSTFKDLKKSAIAINKATEDINDAIKAITNTDSTLNNLSRFVNFSGNLFTAIQSGSFSTVANIFLNFAKSL
jgi:hypothetical protein